MMFGNCSDTKEDLIRKIKAVLVNHEDDLSDGFDWYAGDAGVHRTAVDIAELLTDEPQKGP